MILGNVEVLTDISGDANDGLREGNNRENLGHLLDGGRDEVVDKGVAFFDGEDVFIFSTSDGPSLEVGSGTANGCAVLCVVVQVESRNGETHGSGVRGVGGNKVLCFTRTNIHLVSHNFNGKLFVGVSSFTGGFGLDENVDWPTMGAVLKSSWRVVLGERHGWIMLVDKGKNFSVVDTNVGM